MSKNPYRSRHGWSSARALVALPLLVIAVVYIAALLRVLSAIAAQRGSAFLVGAAFTYSLGGAIGAAMCGAGILLDKAKLRTIGAGLLAASIFAWITISNTQHLWPQLGK